jgi:hypothetical protein
MIREKERAFSGAGKASESTTELSPDRFEKGSAILEEELV